MLMPLRLLVITLLLIAASLVAAFPLNAPTGRYFDHIVIIMLENTDYKTALADANMSRLASTGVLLSNYFAITHPSQPNYIAQIYGSTGGVTSDSDANVEGDSVVDLLERKDLTWSAYMEGYPGGCKTSTTIGKYVRKHNPFISMTSVAQNRERCARIVSSTQLARDLAANTPPPAYIYYTPNVKDDGHDTNVTYAGTWLAGFLPSVMSGAAWRGRRVLFFITFDERDSDRLDPVDRDNQVWTLMLGTAVPTAKAGSKDATPYTHYDLLRLVENNWDLGTLGRNDTTTTGIRFDQLMNE